MNRIKKLLKKENNSPGKYDDNNILSYYHDERDAVDNKITLPPIEEKIYLSTIWVIEAYPPSYFNILEKAAIDLGWDQDSSYLNKDFISTLKKWRSRRFGGGWLNLGYIYPFTTKTITHTRKANLPKGIEWIRAEIYQLLPSCTFLCCQFGLTEEIQNSIEEPLRRQYSTYLEPTRTGYKILQVDSQKRLNTKATRKTIRTLCSSWITNNIPGIFSANKSSLPTVELILLEKHSPVHDFDENNYNSYLRLLGFQRQAFAYKAKSITGLYLFPRSIGRDENNRFVLAGKIDEVLKDEDLSQYAESNKKDEIIHYANHFGRTFSNWALYRLANLFERQLGDLRDEYAAVEIGSAPKIFDSLLSVEKKFIDLQKNSIPLINEIEEYCQNKSSFNDSLYEFSPIEPISKTQLDYFENIRKTLIHISNSFNSNIENIRSVADRISRLISTVTTSTMDKTNLKLQKRIIWLTGILIVLTIRLVIPEEIWEKIIHYFINILKVK